MSENRTKCNNYGLLTNSYRLLFPRSPTTVQTLEKGLFLVHVRYNKVVLMKFY